MSHRPFTGIIQVTFSTARKFDEEKNSFQSLTCRQWDDKRQPHINVGLDFFKYSVFIILLQSYSYTRSTNRVAFEIAFFHFAYFSSMFTREEIFVIIPILMELNQTGQFEHGYVT